MQPAERSSELEAVREAERAHFDSRYESFGTVRPDTFETFLPSITPEYRRGGVPAGLVHLELWKRVLAHGIAGRDVLDYACGAGKWGIRLAQEGARVRGFDLSAVGVERANRRAELAGVDAAFSCADASELPYEDSAFDVVVGIGALHHTIKYPNTARELHRILRPGGIAVFAENFDGGLHLRLARRWTMRHEAHAGDVILTEPLIREWAAAFTDVQIDRYEFLLMAKKLGLPYQALGALHALDRALFRIAPFTRRWCGECVIVLRK